MGPLAVIFDMDGVLADTADLHYRSWKTLADEFGLPFDRAAYDGMRGLGREESLARFLGPSATRFDHETQQDIVARKQAGFLSLLAEMGPNDVLPGVLALLTALRSTEVPTAVGSSSRNAEAVLGRLEIRNYFDVIVDGNDGVPSKPNPAVFLRAAAQLGQPPTGCVVIEDASAGVEAAHRAGMKVVGVGPAERVGKADRRCDSLTEIDVGQLAALLTTEAG